MKIIVIQYFTDFSVNYLALHVFEGAFSIRVKFWQVVATIQASVVCVSNSNATSSFAVGDMIF